MTGTPSVATAAPLPVRARCGGAVPHGKMEHFLSSIGWPLAMVRSTFCRWVSSQWRDTKNHAHGQSAWMASASDGNCRGERIPIPQIAVPPPERHPFRNVPFLHVPPSPLPNRRVHGSTASPCAFCGKGTMACADRKHCRLVLSATDSGMYADECECLHNPRRFCLECRSKRMRSGV